MLKKVGLVAAVTIGLSLAATPAFAAPVTAEQATAPIAMATPKSDPEPTFGTAYWTFIEGGADLGRGAAALVASAYTGIALTPALIAHSFTCGGGC